MKIHQLLDEPAIILSNEEHKFVESHDEQIPIRNLLNHDEVLARNLVRKGVYNISKDSTTLLLRKNDKNNR